MNVEPYDSATCARLQLRLAETPGAFNGRERRLIATVCELRAKVLRYELEELDRPSRSASGSC